MKERLYGNINLTVDSNELLSHDWLITNKYLMVNNHLLEEQDIFIHQINDSFKVSIAVTYSPTSQDEDEAIEEANRVFRDAYLNTYHLEDINHKLISMAVRECNFEWEGLM